MKNKLIKFDCPWDGDPTDVNKMTTSNYFGILDNQLVINLGSSTGDVWIMFLPQDKEDLELAKKTRDLFDQWIREVEGAKE